MLVLPALLALVACNADKPVDSADTADTADTADPTDPADSGDTADTASPYVPVITDVALSWEDFPEVGVSLVATVTIEDEGDDLLGGQLLSDWYPDVGGPFTFDCNLSESVECALFEGTVRLGASDADPAQGYRAEVLVKDASNHVSEPASAVIGPA